MLALAVKYLYQSVKNVFQPGSWQISIFLLVNTAIGAGILNYPAAYDRLGGVTIATILQVLIMFMLASTMLALIFCADLHQVGNYHEVLSCMSGRITQQLAGVSIMCTCFGISVTYLVIIGDQFDRVFYTFVGDDFCHTFWFSRNFTIMVTAVAAIWPMCYFKKLDFLRYASTLGIFAMLYVVFLNVYEYYILDVDRGEIKTRPTNAIEMIASLPVICFAYQTHEIVLPVFANMVKPKISNFVRSTIGALGLMSFIYMLGGTYGYLTFGHGVSADVIQMYDARDPIVVIGIVALMIKMISSYTCQMFCGRETIDGLYVALRKLSPENQKTTERRRRIVETTCWNIAGLILAIVTPNITVAIEFLGSLAACNVFIFPGICMVSLAYRHLTGYYTKVNNERRYLQSMEGTPRWRRVWLATLTYGVVIIILGLAMFVAVIYQAVQDIQHSEETEHHACHA